MDNRPIGVFDSGIGGIAVLAKLADKFPHESFLYLGDNANVPYGSRPQEEIQALALKGISRLGEEGAKAAVIACNTASLALGDVHTAIPAVRLIPAIPDKSAEREKGLFVATPATVRLVKEKNLFPSFADMRFVPLAHLASAIEKSVVRGEEVDFSAHRMPTDEQFDYIYLGCTHYLFVKDKFASIYKTDKFYDGTDFLYEKLIFLLKNNISDGEKEREIRFVGDHAELNSKIFRTNFRQKNGQKF